VACTVYPLRRQPIALWSGFGAGGPQTFTDYSAHPNVHVLIPGGHGLTSSSLLKRFLAQGATQL
jgi:hypothetical protein